MYNHAPSDYENPFEKIVAKDCNHEHVWTNVEDIFYQDDYITAFTSTMCWPGNEGNVLIVPNKCYEHLYDMPDEILAKIHIFSKRVAIAMREVYPCDGISTRQHNEPAGSQDVLHYHLHLIPRYEGDTLYNRYSEEQPSDPDDRVAYAQKLRDYFTTQT